jgi:uroporphyrinogen decarboxylase
MDSRERIRRIISGEFPDQIPLFDTYWITTIERWRQEGLPTDTSPQEYFGTDEIVRIGGDYTMQFPQRTITQTADEKTYWDSDGAFRKDMHVEEGWTSQWLDFTIKNQNDWEQYKHQMRFNPTRIHETSIEHYHHARHQGRFICYSGHACFHPTWMRVGMETMMMLMLDDPDFIYDMFAVHAQLIIDIFNGMLQLGLEFDGVFLADDLGYRTSSLISPNLYRELVFPHHKRLCDYFQNYNLKTFLHSDGNVSGLIPHFIDAGFAGLHPLEAKANLHIKDLQPLYGDKLVLIGNIDVTKLTGSHETIEEEVLSKLQIAKKNGRYIYHSDHSVPNDISFGNYSFLIDLLRKYGQYN